MRSGTRTVGLVVGLVLALMAYGKAFQLSRGGNVWEPVAVAVTPAPGGPPPDATLYISDLSQWQPVDADVDDPGRWTVVGHWVTGLRLVVPEDQWDRVGGVAVRYGDRVAGVSAADARRHRTTEPEALGKDGRTVLVDLTPALPAPTSRVPAYAAVRNWPGDGRVLVLHGADVAAQAAALGLLAGAFAAARRTRFADLARAWLAPAGESAPPPGGRGWDAVGVLFLAGGLATLEARQPYYFTRDDVAVAEVPVYVFGLRSVWAGAVPEYDPFLHLGSAHASTGMMQFTYLPSYLAYAAARHGLGDDLLFAEVSAVLHLVAGYGLTRLLARRVGMGPLPGVLVALSFAFAGAVLIMGRSWHTFVATAVWMPALALSLAALSTGRVGWAWVVGTGAAVGGYFHAGFAQNAAFGCGFLLLGVGYQWAAGRVPGRQAVLLGPALLVGAGLAAPNLVQQVQMMSGVSRGYSAHPGCGNMVSAALVPFPLVRDADLSRWIQMDRDRAGHVAFFGGLFAWLAVAEGAALLTAAARTDWRRQVWLFLAAAAFVLSLGEAGYVWQLGGSLPVVESLFRVPFRMLPFLALFTCLAGGLVLDRLLRRAGSRRTEAVVGAVAVGLLGYHVLMATASFFAYTYPPYPPLPPVLEPLAADTGAFRTRFLTVTSRQSRDPLHAHGLGQDLNVVYRLPTVDGYVPISENATYLAAYERLLADPLPAARAYGVGWVIVATDPTPANSHALCPWGEYVPNGRVGMKLLPLLPPPTAGDGVRVYRVPGAAPLAFAAGKPADPLPMTAGGFGLKVDVSGVPAGDAVTANFLWYPQIRAELDGRPVDAAPDEWNRIRVPLDRPAKELAVRYVPNWGKGVLVGGGLIAVALVLTGLLLRADRPATVLADRPDPG